MGRFYRISGCGMGELVRQQRRNFKQPERIYSLDLLRFFAAAAVVLYHYSYRGAVGDFTSYSLPEITSWSKYGFLGVNLFFVISGFVIAWSAERQSLDRFIGARFLRLYPGFIAGITVTFVALLVMGFGETTTSLAQYLANFIFLPQLLGFEFMDGVYWSIVVEIIFYGWVALFVAFGLFRRYLPEIIAIWLMIAMLNEFVFYIDALRWPLMTPYAGLFATGMLLFRWKIKKISSNWEKLLLATAIVFSMMIETQRGITWGGTSFVATFDRLALTGVMAGLFLLFFIFLHLNVSRKTGKILAIFGSLSYPLYLIHQNFGYMLLSKIDGALNPWLAFVAVTAFMLAISLLIALYVEPAGKRLLKPVVERVIGHIMRLPWLAKRQRASTG